MGVSKARETWASPEDQARLSLEMGQAMDLSFEDAREEMMKALEDQRNDPKWRAAYRRQRQSAREGS
jgi:hypothetical protein